MAEPVQVLTVEFVEKVPENGFVIYNADNQNCEEVVQGLKCKTISFGIKDSQADWIATDIVLNDTGFYSFTATNGFDEIRIKRYFDASLIKKMLAFSGWNIFGVFSDMLKEQGLNLIINLFFGPIVNAARAIAYQVSTAIKGFVSSANMAVRPQIVQSYAQNNKQRSLSLVFSMTKLVTFIYITLGCPIVLEINYILHLWLGESFPDHTDSFVIIVLLISLINNMNSVLSAIVHASGNMRDYQLYGGLVSVLTVPFAYLALKLGCPAESAFWVWPIKISA